MELLLTLLPFAVVASFTPGPNNILVMSCGLSHGLKATVPYQLGAGLACFVIIAFCIMLGASLEKVLPVLLPIMRYAGAAYMLWLAYAVAMAPVPQESAAEGGAATCRNGFLLQFVNPKFYIYSFTLAAVLAPTVRSSLDLGLFSLFFAVVAVAGMGTWAAAGAVLQRFLRRWHRAASVSMGVALVYCAVSLF